MTIRISRLLLLASLCMISGCSSSQEKISDSHHVAIKTTISKEVDANRIDIEDRKVYYPKVWFDGKLLGDLDLDEKKQYPDLPKNLPGGINAYQVTEFDSDTLFLTGGYKTTEEESTPESTDKTFFWDMKEKKLAEGPKMSSPRVMHKITKLKDGKLLITGGMALKPVNTYAKEVDLFIPASKTMKNSGALQVDRIHHAVLEISKTKILIAGGQTYSESENGMETDSIEIYNPENGSSKNLGKLLYPRQGGTLFKLNDKEALIVGGYNSSSESNSRSLPAEMITLQD